MNIVAVSRTTGFPVIARLSGAAGRPGWFDVLGLTADTYGRSRPRRRKLSGSFPGLFPNDVQRYNIAPRSLGPFTVAAGESVDLGDIQLSVAAISIDRISVGPDRQSNSGLGSRSGDAAAREGRRPVRSMATRRRWTAPTFAAAGGRIPAGVHRQPLNGIAPQCL
jgi:hypothetical protein